MELKEIIALERENRNCIHLHREGMFWKAYERSAYLFVTHYTGYQVLKRRYKVVDSDVVSLGFPDATLRKLFVPEALSQVGEKQYCAYCDPIDEAAYARWHAGIPLKPKAEATAPPGSTPPMPPTLQHLTVLERTILDFDLNNEPPLACMNFVQQLKKMILNTVRDTPTM